MVTPVVDRPHETVRDGLGFDDHLGLAHLLLGHVEHRQQFPIPIAETVRDVALCNISAFPYFRISAYTGIFIRPRRAGSLRIPFSADGRAVGA